MSLPYHAPPLTIEEIGPDRIRLTVEATTALKAFACPAIPASVIGAVLIWRSQDAVLGGLGALLLIGFACALIWFLGYRKVTEIDRGRRIADQTRSFYVASTSERALLGDHPTADVGVVVRTHRRSDGPDHTSYQFFARLLGLGELLIGPARRTRSAAEADAAPVARFLAALPPRAPTASVNSDEKGTRPPVRARTASPPEPPDSDLDRWTYPLAPFEASGDCPFCREALVRPDALVCCEQCRTGLHRDCAQELGACPTLGCRNRERSRA